MMESDPRSCRRWMKRLLRYRLVRSSFVHALALAYSVQTALNLYWLRKWNGQCSGAGGAGAAQRAFMAQAVQQLLALECNSSSGAGGARAAQRAFMAQAVQSVTAFAFSKHLCALVLLTAGETDVPIARGRSEHVTACGGARAAWFVVGFAHLQIVLAQSGGQRLETVLNAPLETAEVSTRRHVEVCDELPRTWLVNTGESELWGQRRGPEGRGGAQAAWLVVGFAHLQIVLMQSGGQRLETVLNAPLASPKTTWVG
ncbi:hypothetical protein AK812_SmicGene782 [Symbiodinium microadriaticum]|uniref:Uncharacterized protein n=1 Tax=Symbiodinium microadriaticum TaxID=2951 RepID=A0A1Q9F5P8_SYMMI|nr:hypothetical protein AK812_SmicGene782 [Symbiodinium microadriaticum]